MSCDSARLYSCARCHAQVILGRGCDRGNVYCLAGRAQAARCETLRAAGLRYRQSRRGRLANTERQRRHCERRRRGPVVVAEPGTLAEKVTHHGSVEPAAAALLVVHVIAVAGGAQGVVPALRCSHCRRAA